VAVGKWIVGEKARKKAGNQLGNLQTDGSLVQGEKVKNFLPHPPPQIILMAEERD
jgi:hypothetical protein